MASQEIDKHAAKVLRQASKSLKAREHPKPRPKGKK